MPPSLTLRSSSGTRIRITTVKHSTASTIAATVIDARQVALVQHTPSARGVNEPSS